MLFCVGLVISDKGLAASLSSPVRLLYRPKLYLTLQGGLRRDAVTGVKVQTELFGCLAGCGKTRFEADAVPRNSLVSTAQPDKKKACVEKTSSSWMCLAT
jgi:hypothetical protein